MINGHIKQSAVRMFLYAFLAAGFLASNGLCAEAGKNANKSTDKKAEKDNRDEAYKKMELLAEAILCVKRNYVEDKDYEQIVNGALHGMLQALDSHSDFLDGEAFEDLQEDTKGKYGGIGLQVGMKDGILTVIAPIEDTPAYKAGIQSGDKIVEIDGDKTMKMKLENAVKKMRGQKGTTVVLTIRRADEDEFRKVTIVRDEVDVSSVKGATMMGNGVGYVRITQFTMPTSSLLDDALKKLKEQGMNALVLDLRNNPGGLLTSAIDVTQKFLAKDQVIVSTKGREGVMPKEEKNAKIDGAYKDMPMAVLVNWGSASASEIVAGALQDNKRAVIVGTTTYGKGSVQSVLPLKSGDGKAGLRLTTAKYYTPAGRMIHDKGIDPDVPVYISFKEWRDVQLKRMRAETPALLTKEEKEETKDVVDHQLQRACDLLQAMATIQAKDK